MLGNFAARIFTADFQTAIAPCASGVETRNQVGFLNLVPSRALMEDGNPTGIQSNPGNPFVCNLSMHFHKNKCFVKPKSFLQKKGGMPALPGLQYVTLKALRAHLQHDYQRIQMTGTDFPTHPQCRRSVRSREKKHSVILCAFAACGQTHGISQSSVCHILIS